ncbi:hypothetical protein FB451DRAFT_86336 [Mycena latifolia]|nr:hypothetical protein FB451DRAFT_86336 [Mycena latifolia]
MALVLPRAPNPGPESLVALINEALQDPGKPKACWDCLAGAFYILIHPQEVWPQTEPDFLFGKTCTIWPTILKFVTSPRTDQELASLVLNRKPNQCFCDNDQWPCAAVIHVYARSVVALWNTMWKEELPAIASSPFHCFFSHVFKHLTPYLHDLSPTSVAKRRTQVWPFSPQDCLPFGAEITVKSIHQWIHFYRDPQPFPISLLGVVGHVTRSLVVPTISSAPNLAGDIAKIGHKACDTALQRKLDLSLTDAQVIEVGDAFHRHMWHIEKFFKCLFSESNIQPPELKRLVGGQERSLFDLFCKALELLHTPSFFSDEILDLIPYSVYVFTDAAATMYTIGGLVLQIPPTAQHMRSDVIAAVMRTGKEWGHAPEQSATLPVGVILKSNKERNVCFSLGCKRSIQNLEPDAPVDDRFRRCSGCQLVSYCGRECQVAAWRDAAIPHRDVCTDIKKVVKQGGGSVDAQETWRARVKKGQIDEDLARRVLEWFKKWEAMQGSHFIAN